MTVAPPGQGLTGVCQQLMQGKIHKGFVMSQADYGMSCICPVDEAKMQSDHANTDLLLCLLWSGTNRIGGTSE